MTKTKIIKINGTKRLLNKCLYNKDIYILYLDTEDIVWINKLGRNQK
jgi:hypothetical protein